MLLLSVAACGGGSDPSGAGPSADADAERLRWARCMREHGVNMPDDPKDLPPGGLAIPDRAERACAELRPSGRTIDMNDPETRDRFAAFARCMRANGYDMPDNAPPDVHLKNPPLWDKASKSCAHILREERR
ncbi:hypothetical protein D0T12_20760 [Actinomadura spongiicola]|uniref:Uncharacterized protein n=1 Tax=Actinomadura spongiicola TaxID=2303421 RepID=A0A372GDL5_9ACTN|nr:hypothetical protein D0T12_20760 [Actinomadura spongiicola]